MINITEVKNGIIGFMEAKIRELENKKEAHIAEKQAKYRVDVTNKELAKLEEKRVKAVAEINTALNKQISEVNANAERRKVEIIEADNKKVRDTESIAFEVEITNIRKAIEILKESNE